MKSPLPLIFLPDPAFGRGRGREELAAAALRGGATAIQLRAKDLDTAELTAAGRALAEVCRGHGSPLFLNDRADLVAACGADGVHLGPGDMRPGEARALLGPETLIGVSVYSDEEVREAESAGAAYLAVGAVFPTSTKKIEVVGLEGIARIRKKTRLPVVAIGGIDPENAAEAVAAGADGVAVVSALSAAPDPEAMARELRARIDAALRDTPFSPSSRMG